MPRPRPSLALLLPPRATIESGNLCSVDEALAQAERLGRAPLAVLYAKVSNPQQVTDGDLDRMLRYLRREAEARGLRCHVRTFGEQADGKTLARRHELARARDLADSLTDEETFAFVLATNRTRFKRVEHGGDGRLMREDLDELTDYSRGVAFVTLLDPNASRAEIKAQRGAIADVDGRRNGRPPTRPPGTLAARKAALLPTALRFKAARYSYRAIEAEIGVAVSTLQRWFE